MNNWGYTNSDLQTVNETGIYRAESMKRLRKLQALEASRFGKGTFFGYFLDAYSPLQLATAFLLGFSLFMLAFLGFRLVGGTDHATHAAQIRNLDYLR